jgi:hypothetical protein
MTVKSFITLAPGFYVLKLFSSSLTLSQNKLECFSMANFSIFFHFTGEARVDFRVMEKVGFYERV